MKLTRLRLHGFKSFVEATDFMIEPGLTGVVGPNGCGKSNLVEALRWAMGETSHKSLRAADMDAVIFAGSGNRPSRNHAEVVMTIDNSDRSAPAAVAAGAYPDVPSAAAVMGREQRDVYQPDPVRAWAGLGMFQESLIERLRSTAGLSTTRAVQNSWPPSRSGAFPPPKTWATPPASSARTKPA